MYQLKNTLRLPVKFYNEAGQKRVLSPVAVKEKRKATAFEPERIDEIQPANQDELAYAYEKLGLVDYVEKVDKAETQKAENPKK